MDDEVSFDGEKLFEGHGLTFYGKTANDELFNHAIVLYVENSTDSEFLFKADGVTIDGVSNECTYPFTICENSSTLFYLEFGHEYSETEDSESVTENPDDSSIGEEYEIEFEIYDRADVSLVGKTGVMKLNMK